ncbi:hypothetical protein FRX31_024967 [Thalictrum thalictroides]|uniref:Uncharacterized protein n=1 Tax=Thalictrum thalictroides TaxID=46969 RepID=A0A7J6VK29_THATH|nr:hypothetical protein FRX31_024967 [Thalictrum thalictroides]
MGIIQDSRQHNRLIRGGKHPRRSIYVEQKTWPLHLKCSKMEIYVKAFRTSQWNLMQQARYN